MKKIRIMLSLVAVAAITAFFAGITGCEKDASTDTGLDAYFASHPYITDPRTYTTTAGQTGAFEVEPNDPAGADAKVVGQQIGFTVKGGENPFRWDVSIPSAGTAAAAPENSRYGIYTVRQVTRNSIIVSDNAGRAVVVDITASAVLIPIVAISIIPSSYTFTSVFTNETPSIPPFDLTGQTLAFQVSGGVPPYVWNAANPSLGAINNSGVYTVDGTTGIGANTITVTDNAGSVAQATVTTQMKP